MPGPRTAAACGLGALLALYVVVAVVDGADLGGSWLAGHGLPPAWYLLFEEGSPVEWIQTVVLLALLVAAADTVATVRHHPDAARPAATRRLLWWLVAGIVALLVEDTGNVGERLRWLTEHLWDPGAEVLGLVRMPLFALAAALLTWALAAHRTALVGPDRAAARRWLVAGYATYAVMGITGELLNYLVDLYDTVGSWVAEDLLGGRLAPPTGTSGLWSDYHVVLMDYVYEESLELLAATFLLAGVLALRRDVAAAG